MDEWSIFTQTHFFEKFYVLSELSKNFDFHKRPIIELLFEVEEKYGFQIENPMELANMTIEEIVCAVEKTLAEKNAAGALPSA